MRLGQKMDTGLGALDDRVDSRRRELLAEMRAALK